MRSRSIALALAAVALLPAGCQEDSSTAPNELPDPVAETRSEILDAAKTKDYEALRPLIDRELFLSDAGFADPVDHWRKLGAKPLETMGVLLQLRYAVRKTNEGTLYQWPRFDPNSKVGDITADERRLLRTVMTEAEVRTLIRPEYGYTAPRLGILADGTWWFFVLDRAP